MRALRSPQRHAGGAAADLCDDDEPLVYAAILVQEMRRWFFGGLPVAVNKDLKLSCVFAGFAVARAVLSEIGCETGPVLLLDCCRVCLSDLK